MPPDGPTPIATDGAGTFLRTGDAALDGLYPAIRDFLAADVMELTVDGTRVRGFRTPDAASMWIRDHCDMLRGGRYFFDDMTSVIDHFAETQSATGRIFDYFTTCPEKLPCERENWTKYVRVPVEADVEFRFVKAVWLAWQAGGDDEWAHGLLPAMEKALAYIRSHPWYWDEEVELVKRAYTIDTWDFAYTAGAHDWLQFQIDDRTFWGIMHGDNSGYYEAYRIMAALHRHVGDAGRAAYWDDEAAGLRRRMNDLCWNGRFYTHFVKRSPVEIDGVDEAAQLSLSNPMDINRGAADHEMAVAIIEEYRRRREATDAFAEWFSIDPPFPDGIFGDEKLVGGAYCNGGIMPLVGGELARAAFEHGFEDYGVDILRRYWSLIGESRSTYLWYHPDGRPASVEASTSPEAQPTDGWGSSAMLYALVEGLVGVVDQGRSFQHVRLSPRWPAAGVDTAEARVAYGASPASVAYEYRATRDAVTLDVRADQARIDLHLLLPAGRRAETVHVDGAPVPFAPARVRQSAYADVALEVDAHVAVRVDLAAAPDVSP